jgi:hypothetical protein
VIVAAAVCPHPPLLLRELTGQQEVAPDLREACLRVIGELIDLKPDRIVVLGGADTTTWSTGEGDVDIRGYGTFAVRRPGPYLPLSLGVAKRLLAEAHWHGDTQWLAVAADADPQACAELGKELAARPGRVALLVMADGSARRTAMAPGYLDERAQPFDAQVTQALAAGDTRVLRELNAELADQLLVYGRAALQVLGSAVPEPAQAGLRYLDDPFGVLYFVSLWENSL